MKQWLFAKLINYLVDREGYTYSEEEVEVGNNTIRVTLQDSFGYRYSLSVVSLGRISNTGFDDYALQTGSYLKAGLNV